MAFLCRQGLVRVEVIVGLLIMLGMILGGSEGIKCYQSEPPTDLIPTDCPAESNACIQSVKGKLAIRKCITVPSPQCMDHVFGSGVCVTLEEFQASKFDVLICLMKLQLRATLPTQNTTEEAALNLKTALDNPASKTGRKIYDESVLRNCHCYTDLCNVDIGNAHYNGGAGDHRNPTSVTWSYNDDQGDDIDDPIPNPAGRSTHNNQVIFAIILSAALYFVQSTGGLF